ncbi:MAG: aromatic amino acid lyase [Alphaproteobacteria bacterium]
MPEITLAVATDLTPAVYRRVIYGGEALAAAPALLDAVAAKRAAFLRLLDSGVHCYGVNTAHGAMIVETVPKEEWPALQRNVLRARAAGTGPPFAPEVARGMMLARLFNLLSGYAAASAELCRFVIDRLNDGFTPWVPSRGHGMAGELIPHCHMAQTFVGDGFVIGPGGARVPAAEALAARGVAPYEPQAKEGLSLVNGVSASTAYAIHAHRAVAAVAEPMTLIATATAEAIGAPVEPFDAALDRLRPDPGIARVAAQARRHIAGSRITRRDRQGPISLRIIPQVHGALMDALDHAESAIANELVSVSDNPVFVSAGEGAGDDRILATGTFHNQHVTGALEGLALALAQVGILSQRRLHRLLDARFTGLSHQLSPRPGMDAGLVILHKAVLAHEARLKLLAAPVSLHHGEASFGQEDFMPMIFPVIDRLFEMADIVRLIGAYELYATAVALDQRGERAGKSVEAMRALVREVVPPYDADRSYGPEVEALDALLQDARFAALAGGESA